MDDLEKGMHVEGRGEAASSASRRGFIKRAGLVAAGATALLGGVTFSTAFADSSSCTDTTTDILRAALTAEQLATTFYYQGVAGPRASNLGPVHNANNLNYFQAALWQEYQHASIFASLGVASLAGANPQFYFPTNAFDKADTFLAVLDALETAFVAAYLAAIRTWADPTSPAATSVPSGFSAPQLAEIAGQLLGTEAEHRALGRVASGTNPPNNLILEQALFSCVGTPTDANGTAVGALLPFVAGGSGFAGPYVLPSGSQIATAASPYTNLTNPGLATP